MNDDQIHSKLFLECYEFEKKIELPIHHNRYNFHNENKEIVIKNYKNTVFHHRGTISQIDTYYNIKRNSMIITIQDELHYIDRMYEISNLEDITSIVIRDFKED